MEPLPPPPPPRPDMSWRADDRAAPAATPARPQLATAAGVILIVLGVLQAIAGAALMVIPDQLARLTSIGDGDLERIARGIGLFVLVVGSLGILAGILVLRLSEAGRIFAIVLASIGILGGIRNLSSGNAAGVITLGLYGFVIYVLFATGTAFHGRRQG